MDSSASYNINITLHVLILFTFLTIFFFTFLSQVEVKNVNNVMSKLVGDQTKNTLDLIKSNSDKIPELSISKDNLSNVANNMEKSSKVPIKSTGSSIPFDKQLCLYSLKKLLGCPSKIPPGLIAFTLILLSFKYLAIYSVK